MRGTRNRAARSSTAGSMAEAESVPYIQNQENQERQIQPYAPIRNRRPGPDAELRKQYSDLIEQCDAHREIDGIEDNLQEDVTNNITEGMRLFQSLTGGPGEMYMAFYHSKHLTGLILHKTEKIGNSTSAFALEDFHKNLIDKVSLQSSTADYSQERLATYINNCSLNFQHGLSPITAIIGSFDRKTIATPPEAKEKKPRAARKKAATEEERTTIHEKTGLSDTETDNDTPEKQSQGVLQILSKENSKTQAPINLMEFAMETNSLTSYLQHLFYVAFLVKDGHVALKREKRGTSGPDEKLLDSHLVIIPETSKEKSKNESADTSRSQHIISFNPTTYKLLAESCQGEAMIPPERKDKKLAKR